MLKAPTPTLTDKSPRDNSGRPRGRFSESRIPNSAPNRQENRCHFPLGVLVWTTQVLLTTPSFFPQQRRRRRRRSVWLMRSGRMDPALERQDGLGPGGLFSWREWVCEVTFLLGPPTPRGWLYSLDQAWGRQLESHVDTGPSCPHDFPDGPVLQAGGWVVVLVCLPPARLSVGRM